MAVGDAAREIKSRLDIVEVISDYVRLKKSGKNYWGLCPFHSEKTPSFSVSEERQAYHCFGCGKGGDVFSFIMEIEGLDFPQALQILAPRAGVDLKSLPDVAGKKDVEGALEEALAFFKSCLMEKQEGEGARAYLRRRNLFPEDWKRFELGWAPSSWDALTRHYAKRGVPKALALESGMTAEGSRGLYDRFRGRVMFPIRNELGKLVAFGGRLIDGEGAKYINSPESPLYSKGRTLFLLDRAKKTIRESGRALLVEGYLDAIRCHLCGFEETVASLGTALTEEQASLIRKYAETCLICYDADSAGQAATLRSMYLLWEAGLDVRVVRIPRGKDPDELLSSSDGIEIFEEAIESALPLPLYHIEAKSEDLASSSKRKKALAEILEGLSRIEILDLAPQLPVIAKKLGVLPHQLAEALEKRARKKGLSLEKVKSPSSSVFNISSNPRKEEEATKIFDPVESAFCYVLWEGKVKLGDLLPQTFLPLISDPRVQRVAEALLGGESPEELELRWQIAGDSVSPAIIAAGGASLEQMGLLPEEGLEVLSSILRRRGIEREYATLKEKMLREKLTEEEILRFRDLAEDLKGRSKGA